MVLKSMSELGLNIENNEDCKKYILEHEQYHQSWTIYLEYDWEGCSVIDVENKGLIIKSATVKTEKRKVITREARFIFPGEKREKDYIYFTERRGLLC